jgi:hypothetical protein
MEAQRAAVVGNHVGTHPCRSRGSHGASDQASRQPPYWTLTGVSYLGIQLLVCVVRDMTDIHGMHNGTLD